MIRHAVLAAALVARSAGAAVDVDAPCNHSDPAAGEARFLEALTASQGDDTLILRTQIARTFSLRQR